MRTTTTIYSRGLAPRLHSRLSHYFRWKYGNSVENQRPKTSKTEKNPRTIWFNKNKKNFVIRRKVIDKHVVTTAYTALFQSSNNISTTIAREPVRTHGVRETAAVVVALFLACVHPHTGGSITPAPVLARRPVRAIIGHRFAIHRVIGGRRAPSHGPTPPSHVLLRRVADAAACLSKKFANHRGMSCK